MKGCSDCANQSECLECGSPFLDVDPIYGGCTCNGTGDHMAADLSTKSCVCDFGYFITEEGCMRCNELIPNCSSCFVSLDDTGLPIYQGANLSNEIIRQ